jgi:protoporphyrinogen oxidase
MLLKNTQQNSKTITMQKFDFIVLGAGLSGLSFAKRVTDYGKMVLVLEKEQTVGGLSRTIHHNGFYLDLCAHRFHTNNKPLLKEILALDGLHMNKQVKKSRIYMFNKYLKYPFEIQNLLRAMPVNQSIMCGLSFLYSKVTSKFTKGKKPLSYKDWFISIYGPHLYKYMCEPYTSKIWHMDPANLSADWAEQRFGGESMRRLLKRIVRKIVTLNFSSYELEDDEITPDAGPFYYPTLGIQELPDAIMRTAIKNGAQVDTSANVTSIDSRKKTVSYRVGEKTYEVEYNHLVSTIPIHQFYKLLGKKDTETEKALQGLKYMNVIFVYLFINKPRVSNDHWLYYPDKDLVFNRAVEFSNWSPQMCPPGQTAICFDITSFEDGAWTLDESQLAEQVIRDAVKINYIRRQDIISQLVVKIEHAYPFYDLSYKDKLDKAVNFLESDSISLLGRTGIFKYNNADNSIEMGFELAERLLQKKDRASIYKYKVENVSL